MHPFHLVTLSPWPLFVCLILLSFGLNIVSWLTIGQNGLSIIFILSSLIFITILWFRDIIREGLGGYSTKIVQRGIIISFLLFLITEIMIFVTFFWAFFNYSLAPAIELGNVWPPVGIISVDVYSLPFLGTFVLLTSGFYLTQAHEHFISAHKVNALFNLFISIILGLLFVLIQSTEYTFSQFTISDSVFGNIFFTLTGLHGFHIIIGVLFLCVSFIRIYFDQFSTEHHLGLEFSIYYYHLVDIIWLILMIVVYWWGGA